MEIEYIKYCYTQFIIELMAIDEYIQRALQPQYTCCVQVKQMTAVLCCYFNLSILSATQSEYGK